MRRIHGSGDDMKLKVRLPSQKRGIKTKNKMIDSAIRLFSEFGYHKTTTKMIAEDSGVAIGARTDDTNEPPL